MTKAKDMIEASRKIVIKIGSNTIAGKDGAVSREAINSISSQIETLIGLNKQVVVVSSGAGISGVSAINKWSRRQDMHYKQALCAIGQVELMEAYKQSFQPYNRHVAQLLLTRDDFKDSTRSLNIRNTLFTLIDEGVVPVVNENDTVCYEEIKIGDNDTLAALTAGLWNADLLIMLSDIDGVYDKNPKTNKNAELIECIYNVSDILPTLETEGTNEFGTGGILTKIEAAEEVNKYGISTILANGKKADILVSLLAGTEKATIFMGGTNI